MIQKKTFPFLEEKKIVTPAVLNLAERFWSPVRDEVFHIKNYSKINFFVRDDPIKDDLAAQADAVFDLNSFAHSSLIGPFL